MESKSVFSVTFHGVRGSYPTSGSQYSKYGGCTPCVELRCGENAIILDAGTGIRSCGKNLEKDKINLSTLLISHCHWDHIQGFPFFTQLFNRSFRLNVYAGHLGKVNNKKITIKDVFQSQMSDPVFPLDMSKALAKLTFTDFKCGDSLSIIPGVTIETKVLNHPNGATGYRITYNGKTVSYITDTEHIPNSTDENVLELMKDSDLVIYDSAYSEEIFKLRKGWGHSTWNEGVRLCKLAGAKKMAMFHHDPENDDKVILNMETQAKNTWSKCFAAVGLSKIYL